MKATPVPISVLTARLHLRNLRTSDLDDFLDYRSDPEVTRLQGFEPMERTTAAAFIAGQADRLLGTPGEWLQYGIEEIETGRIVGDGAIRLLAEDPRMAELGITLSRRHQGRGFAREAVQGMLDFLFHDRELHRVVAITDLLNLPAIALMESLAFRKEGEFLEHYWFKGRWSSEAQFAMLHREWTGRPKG